MNGGVEPQVQVGDFFEEEEETVMAAVKEREIWLQNNNGGHQGDEDDLLAGVMDDASLFYADDDFPCLPDFSCMSSSSSSSSPAAVTVKTVTCASSSSNTSSSNLAASWANLKSDAELRLPPPQTQPPALSSTASMEIQQPPDHQGGTNDSGDCLDMMDTFGTMELMEGNEFFDPSSIFENEENLLDEFVQWDPNPPEEGHASGGMILQEEHQQQQQQQPPPLAETATDEEMSSVFLEWLKINKDSVSATDLRNVRLKKATIECAAKRLGGGKEGMKQLLKLILEWVQTSHLQKKRRLENHVNNNNENDNLFTTHFLDTTNPSSNLNHQPSFGLEWISQPPYGVDPAALPAGPPPFPQPLVGYSNNLGDPFSSGASNEFHAPDSSHSWPHSQFTVYTNHQPYGNNNLHPSAMAGFGGYGNNQYPYQYFHGGGGPDRLGPLATKEARKKRMARQRRHLSHHRHHNNVQDHQQNQQSPTSDYYTAATVVPHANPPNWLYWPPPAPSNGGAASVVPTSQGEPPPSGRNVGDRMAAMQSDQNNNQQNRVSSDKRQGWKPEKNLKFLLQKVLKQSDVGNLGRIVLPKREAETHLPELEERDGISIAMEDIGTCRVWNMRYRYWPNNKSRMYLLENTGDFVRANGLQEGDFIVIYSDVKCGKYMIRGVKVRQAAGTKVETKKAASGKCQKANGSDTFSPNKNERTRQ
ncbi:B3 domain-containing transcription factor ABI3-like [Neltuma alba]|uniref:B3 domain-containing transcription factor ABI3-like n=1 Tax=Neltuma alba TaxID=207710 RepID=UPI0010A36DC3|nr:B3 domain-containing transcription factor ABI3-like [Prosopis alba]